MKILFTILITLFLYSTSTKAQAIVEQLNPIWVKADFDTKLKTQPKYLSNKNGELILSQGDSVIVNAIIRNNDGLYLITEFEGQEYYLNPAFISLPESVEDRIKCMGYTKEDPFAIKCKIKFETQPYLTENISRDSVISVLGQPDQAIDGSLYTILVYNRKGVTVKLQNEKLVEALYVLDAITRIRQRCNCSYVTYERNPINDYKWEQSFISTWTLDCDAREISYNTYTDSDGNKWYSRDVIECN